MGRPWHTLAGIAVVVCMAAGLVACSIQPQPSTVEPRHTQYEPTLVGHALSPAASIATHVLDYGVDRWFHNYASSRVIEISLPEREPQAFGPWEAVPDFGATDARADGSLTEWDEHYYITHDWSEYGQQILTMRAGDSVSVNGQTMHVEGVFEYPKNSFYNEIMQITGGDAIVFQTCVPNSDTNRIVYGHV